MNRVDRTVSPNTLRLKSSQKPPTPVAASRVMKDLLAFAARAAETDATVLITGETGVGKDVIAQYIHQHSPRANNRLIQVNCAAFLDELLASELFGHTRGSFTGAWRDRGGLLERADQGTLFLDEVAEMSPRMQSLLLRFLDYGEIQPVGTDRSAALFVNVRIIAATNVSLASRVDSGQFRHDLYYRLHVVEIAVPPLRERPEDIRPLVEWILARRGETLQFGDDAWDAMRRYYWPGNVRELQNVLERVLAREPSGVVERQHLPAFVLRRDN